MPVDAEYYRNAVAAQFPQLDLSGFRFLAEGGVFWVCQTNAGLIWRFLKRPEFAASLDLEIRLLPELAPALPLPIPRYEYISDPAITPRFVGYRKIEGAAFERDRLAACRSDLPLRQLADFVTRLHRFPVERAQAAGIELPTAAERRANRLAMHDGVRQHVLPLLDDRQRAWAASTLSDLERDDAMLDFQPVLCHGDLWAEHILFDPEREALTGVIDFESAVIGDPATDWVAMWLEHGESVVERLLSYYRGPADAALRRRVARLAHFVPLHEILCGVLYDDRASWNDGWERVRGMSS